MEFPSSGVSSAYGSGRASGTFDPVTFIKKPQVILRLVSWLFSIIVFACIASEGWINPQDQPDPTLRICQYNGDANACNYGTAIGVIAFLACIVFLLIDAMFDNLSNVKTRRFAVLGDLGFSAFWAFLWFVGFCYLTDQWRKAGADRAAINPDGTGTDQMQAAIAFSFFSIGTWGALAFLAFTRYRQGVASDFQGGFGEDAFQPGGGAGGVGGSMPPPNSGYSPAPFAGGAPVLDGNAAEAGNAYQQQPYEAPNY